MRVIFVLVLAGCAVDADYSGTNYRCGSDMVCPDGTTCTAGYCLPPQVAGTTCARDVTSGDEHVCALRSDGTVWCWGRNESGQLGDNTVLDQALPVQAHLAPAATSVVGGAGHTCAIASGALWCWGNNAYGQLGDGTTTDAKEPVMAGASGVTQVAAGDGHTCALANGAVSCWGRNNRGQLGDGTNADSKQPVPVAGLSGVTALAAGGDASCAVAGDGQLYCWGENGNGQLGDGTYADKNAPVAMVGLPGSAVGASVGRGVISAVLADGTVWSVGDNNAGKLGNSSSDASIIPVRTLTGGTMAQLSLHEGHACGVDTDHKSWCWGYDYDGEFFDQQSTQWFAPVSTLFDVTKLAIGQDHACALTQGSAILCAGYNGWGQLGDGQRTTQPTPQNTMIGDAKTVFAGGETTCVMHTDDTLSCWGNGTTGQLGDGGSQAVASPVATTSFGTVVKISQNDDETCSLDDHGVVRCSGSGDYGRLGNDSGYVSRIPTIVAGLPPAMDVSVGIRTVCAALGSAGAMCWGFGDNNQLGAGSYMYAIGHPVQVAMPLVEAKEVAVGDSFGCALTSAGSVYCWGNSYVTGMNASAPVAIAGLSNVSHISASGAFVCALAGTDLYCWGYNAEGQVGDNTTNSGSTPAKVLTGVSQVSAGVYHACAIKTDGTVWCWGYNVVGQIGDGTFNDVHAPKQIAVPGMATSISAGSSHTCAVTTAGTYCWGGDIWGELGIGVTDWLTVRGVNLPCP